MADSNVFRWVTRNFYSKTELTAGALATLYYAKTDFLNASAGAGDAGKPVKLDAGGQIDATMINDGDIDHGSTGGLTDDDHTQYALLLGRAAGQTLYGGTAANDDITIHGTSNATRTTSYVILQPSGGNVVIGATSGAQPLTVVADYSSSNDAKQVLITGSSNTNQQLEVGYNTTSDYGSVQAVKQGTGFKALILNPLGGSVGVGIVTPDGFQVNAALVDTAQSTKNLRIGVVSGGGPRITYEYDGSNIYSQDIDSSGNFRWFIPGSARMTLSQAGVLALGGDNVVTLAASQTLTNKTLTIPTIVAAGWANANHTHAGSTTGGTIAHTALTSIGTNTHAQIDTHLAATAAHGVAVSVVGTTDSQTLTNKTLTTPTIANLYGSVSSAGNLTLDSTSHATKGSVLINSGGGYVGAGQFSTFPAYNFEVSALRSAHYYSIGISPDDASGGRGFIYSRKDGANNPLVLTGSQVILFSDDHVFNMPNSKVPSSASDTGNAGDIAWGPSFLYVATANNTWKRVAISTW